MQRENVISKLEAWQQDWKGCMLKEITVMDALAKLWLLRWVMLDQAQFVNWFIFIFIFFASEEALLLKIFLEDAELSFDFVFYFYLPP